MKPEAIILCGGQGTRIKDYLPPNVPKCMADINGKPFLRYLLDSLTPFVSKIVIASGLGYEKVIDYFKVSYNDVPLVYRSSINGVTFAVKDALTKANQGNRDVFIINGDTYFDDFSWLLKMMDYHQREYHYLTLSFSTRNNKHTGIDLLRIKPGFASRGSIFTVDEPFWDIGTKEGLEEFREKMK